MSYFQDTLHFGEHLHMRMWGYVEDCIFLIIISNAGKPPIEFGEPTYFLRNSHLKWLLELQIAPIFLHHHPAQYKLLFCGCNYPHSTIYMYFSICAGCAWQIQNCITETNTATVINKLCTCWWFYSKGHLHHTIEDGGVLYTLIASSAEQH